MPQAEDGIFVMTRLTIWLSAQERQENYDNKKIFDSVHRDIKARARRPDTEVAGGVHTVRPGLGMVFSGLCAKNIVNRVTVAPVDDAGVRRFYGECEPFRSLMVALFAQSDVQPHQARWRSLHEGRAERYLHGDVPSAL